MDSVISLFKCAYNQGWLKTECTMRIVAEIHERPSSRNLVFWNPTTPTDGRVSVFCWTVRRIEAHCAAGNNVPAFEDPSANPVIRTSP